MVSSVLSSNFNSTILLINPVSWSEPAGLVTVTAPEAPSPITAVIWVLESTVNEDAGWLPNNTELVSKKPVPVITTVSPLPAVLGSKLVTWGAVYIIWLVWP